MQFHFGSRWTHRVAYVGGSDERKGDHTFSHQTSNLKEEGKVITTQDWCQMY